MVLGCNKESHASKAAPKGPLLAAHETGAPNALCVSSRIQWRENLPHCPVRHLSKRRHFSVTALAMVPQPQQPAEHDVVSPGGSAA